MRKRLLRRLERLEAAAGCRGDDAEVWKHFDAAMERMSEAFAEADKAFKAAREAQKDA